MKQIEKGDLNNGLFTLKYLFLLFLELASSAIFYWPRVSIRDRIDVEIEKVQLLTLYNFAQDSRDRGGERMKKV